MRRPPGVPMPEEWADFCLLREMGWSWRDLTGDAGVPAWFELCCKQFLRLLSEERARRANAGGRRGK